MKASKSCLELHFRKSPETSIWSNHFQLSGNSTEFSRKVTEYLKTMAEGGLSLTSSCSICCEEFKSPRILPCGHSFCCQCLTKLVGYSYSYQIKCPECRRDVNLPQSGKAEDFPTNFALMNVLEAQNQNKITTLQASSMQGVAAGPTCTHHKIPMKFYCETCKIQVCAECLLGDHNVRQHRIASAADVAANLSHHLQRSTEKLQYYEQEKQALGDKINESIQNCHQDQVRLQAVVQQNLQKEIQKVQEAATKMLNQISEKAKVWLSAYTNLQQQYSNVNTLHDQIKGKCRTLKQNFQQVDLSQSAELEQLDPDIDKLKNQIDSLKATCQLTPADVGLVINPAQCELGITLSQVTPKPMILQASGQVQNRNNSPHSNNAAGQLRGAVYQYASLPHSGYSYNFSQAQPLISS